MRKVKPLGKGSFVRRVLRALGKDSGFELPLSSREEKHLGVSAYYAYYGFHKELRNAMLEVERLKAKGIMEYQRNNLPR
ncbi:MAG: hypothetical protein OEY24_00105 [Candidatus Bathyarchaeota archaeon]|nr:hypothetical protein [Candidatus Bathyarchaeota archaeon]MDH5494095.1 hypothetical protein [Candidatus Bathyarchaeota archaeon]